jgi:hypothetical protein
MKIPEYLCYLPTMIVRFRHSRRSANTPEQRASDTHCGFLTEVETTEGVTVHFATP